MCVFVCVVLQCVCCSTVCVCVLFSSVYFVVCVVLQCVCVCVRAPSVSRPPVSPQAIQHIERTQERRGSAEEDQRRAVIVSPAHVAMDTACSDTATDTEGEDDCSMN